MKTRFFLLAFLLILPVVPSSGLASSNCGADECTSQQQCANGYGDCDNNNDCVNGTCVYNAGLLYGCPRWVDICVSGGQTSSSSSTSTSSTTTGLSTTSTIAPYLPNCAASRCLASSPCSHGYGDCDSDADCVNSTCFYNVGLLYGCPRWVDVCLFNVQASFTSSSSSSSSLVSSSSSSSSLPNVYGCRILEVPNREYRQMADIAPAVPSAQGCITVNGSNITFDCRDFLMSNSSFDAAGVYSNQLQTVVKNCNISLGESGYGVYMEGANGSRISNSLLSYQGLGVYLGQTYNTVIENTSLFNDSFGVFILQGAGNNLSRVTVARPNSSLFDINITINLTYSSQGYSSDSLSEDGVDDGNVRGSIGAGSNVLTSVVKDAETLFDRLSSSPLMADGRLDVKYVNDIKDSGTFGGLPGNKIETAPSYDAIGILILNSTNNTLAVVTVNGSLFGIVIGQNSHYSRLSTVRVSGGFFGLAIGNSSYNTMSNIIAYGNLLGVLIVRNSSSNTISTVTELFNLLGLTFASSSYNAVTGVLTSRGLLGTTLLSSSYNNFTGIRAYNNTALGLTLLGGTGNMVRNGNLSESGIYDFLLAASSNEHCVQTIENLSSSGGRMIAYYDSAVSLSNDVLAELVLCGADYSVLDNLTIYGSDSLYNNGVMVLLTNSSNLTNINSSENYDGFYIISSYRNRLSNLTANNNSDDGVYMDSVGHNTISNLTALYNDDDGLDIGYSSYDVVSDVTADYNWDDGVYLYRVNNSNMSGIAASYNYDGIYLYYSYHNLLLNGRFNNNSNDGVSFYSSSHNSLSGLSMSNNSDYGIQFYYGVNNTFSDVTNNENQGGIFMSDSSNNTFSETGLVNNASRNLYVTSDSRNIVMLNSTYNTSWEYVVSNSQLFRRWYLDVYVNDSDGDPFENVNVSAWDLYGTFVLNTTTGADGFIPTATLAEYINNGSRYYYNNHTLSALGWGFTVTAHGGGSEYFAANKSVNVSNNLLETFTLNVVAPT